ncbi:MULTISPECIES: SRPBCC family protein [unclassified Sphingobium]|uniref:SRPBCC family protein n=1 Tax=unclassified Sphingobium TaxID=2611147 RepID=UPI001E5A97B4|nr:MULTISPECIES: SRPBCC family protein [unclassified Sphingobium]CAH0355152.1 hypothetical protein SPH9361_03279 [Sphingobium sp. CECT 9361]|tara:strand:+ start:9103 stop:9600 length:498 start_codon:yes stop_codon:yes gene_type:complete
MIDNVTSLKASPLRVWSVLTDFAGHSQWKPAFQLSGAATLGGDTAYTFRIDRIDKSVTARADITSFDKPVTFAWVAGVPKLLMFEEAYALEREPTGTRLRHTLRFSGLLGDTLAALMRRKLHASLIWSDICLERYLRRLSAQPNPNVRSSPARHGAKGSRSRRQR